jgi:hypothetical protein
MDTVYVPPPFSPLSVMLPSLPPQEAGSVPAAVMAGTGFTVILKLSDEPAHPFADGVTVIVPLCGAFVALVAVNDGMDPVPLPPRPIPVLSFVQL